MRIRVIGRSILLLVLFVPLAVGQDDVLLTDQGAQVKLIARQDGAIFEQPDEKSASRPLKKFSFLYALKPGSGKEETQSGFYCVSATPSGQGFLGWVLASGVLVWPHRDALGLMPRQGRDLAVFFGSKEDLESYCAGKDVTPLSRETSATLRLNLLPILSTFPVRVGPDEVRGYKVAYLHSAAAGIGVDAANVASDEGPLMDLQQSKLQIVFVMDSTASTTPFHANMVLVQRVAELLARQGGEGPAIEVALVCYRDLVSSPPPDWYHVRLFSDFTSDFQAFLGRVQTVHAATLDSEDFPEDVLAGIDEALQKLTWDPQSFKHCIVLGDASAHLETSGPKNPRRLTIEGTIARAQPRGLETIRQKTALHAIRVIGLDPTDHRACEMHFRALAAGGDSPGLYHEFDGRTGNPAFIDKLASIILKSREGLVRVKRGQEPAPDTPALGLLLEMVAASKSADNVPEFAEGFVCETDRHGHQQLEPFVLVERAKADLFSSAVDYLIKALASREPGTSDLKHFLRQLQVFSADIQLGDTFTGNTSLQEFFAKVMEIPVQSNCFAVTLDQLPAMSAADLENWIRDVRASESIVKAHIENEAIWFSLADRRDERFAFIKLSDMP